MDKLLEKYEQVFVVMPPKCAGTTYIAFTVACDKSALNGTFWKVDGLFLPKRHNLMENAFKDNFKVPTLISNHVNTDTEIIDLVKHATRDSLIIFSHREETSRYMSGITEELHRRCTREFKTNKNECTLTQDELMNLIRQNRIEIGWDNGKILTCDLYNAIRENAPNFVFVYYKQTSKIQKLLTKHHCPDYKEVLHSRSGAQKRKVKSRFGFSGQQDCQPRGMVPSETPHARIRLLSQKTFQVPGNNKGYRR